GPRVCYTLPLHDALPIYLDRLDEGALDATAGVEAGLAAAVAHRLVLQRALATLVADRAVERVVDQQELHHPALRLVGAFGGELGVDLHALGDHQRAGGLRLHPSRRSLHLAHAAVGSGHRHLDQALATGADRRQQRVVAEPRDLDADLLGGPDHQRALRRAHLDAVDGQVDHLGAL